MTAASESIHEHGGRRPKAFREGTRGKLGATVPLYGDFGVAVDDAGFGEVSGRAIVKPDGGGNEARGAWQQETDADASFTGWAGYPLGRTLTVLVLDQRDRSALQGRMMLGGLMRCRS